MDNLEYDIIINIIITNIINFSSYAISRFQVSSKKKKNIYICIYTRICIKYCSRAKNIIPPLSSTKRPE